MAGAPISDSQVAEGLLKTVAEILSLRTRATFSLIFLAHGLISTKQQISKFCGFQSSGFFGPRMPGRHSCSGSVFDFPVVESSRSRRIEDEISRFRQLKSEVQLHLCHLSTVFWSGESAPSRIRFLVAKKNNLSKDIRVKLLPIAFRCITSNKK